MPSSPFGVLFDFDGVIVDSAMFHFRAWQRLGEEVGVPVTEEFFRGVFGRRGEETIPLLLGRPVAPDELQRLQDFREAAFRASVRGQLRPLPGAAELVHRLHADDRFCAAVASSTPRANLDLILGEIGLLACFDAIVSAEDVTHGKPDPEVFLTAATRIGVPPDRCTVIEDALFGIEAARRAGMRAIAVTTSLPRERLTAADAVVESLAEVSEEALRTI